MNDTGMDTPVSLGLGNLALGLFVQSWRRSGRSAIEHLRSYARPGGHSPHLDQCADDARCLLASGLAAEDLERLWCWSTGGNHLPSQEGLTGREWMSAVSEILAAYGRPAHMPHEVDAATAARVAHAVELFRPGPQHMDRCPISTVDARRILRQLVDSGHAELAMRLFLTLSNASFSLVAPELRAEIAATSRDLGHPDHFLEEIDEP